MMLMRADAKRRRLRITFQVGRWRSGVRIGTVTGGTSSADGNVHATVDVPSCVTPRPVFGNDVTVTFETLLFLRMRKGGR
jgi:hypothetical protein